MIYVVLYFFFFFSSRRRHTRCALVTGVQTCALPIFHTGGIYRGRRDPSPLFDAISRYPDLKRRVRVVFYGLATDYVPAIARDFEVEDSIEVHPRVEHTEALRQQRLSDVLLLMQDRKSTRLNSSH